MFESPVPKSSTDRPKPLMRMRAIISSASGPYSIRRVSVTSSVTCEQGGRRLRLPAPACPGSRGASARSGEMLIETGMGSPLTTKVLHVPRHGARQREGQVVDAVVALGELDIGNRVGVLGRA